MSGDALTVGSDNVGVGRTSLTSDTKGSKSIAIGTGTLQNQNFTSATDAYNVAIGYLAGGAVTTGQNNTLIGAQAGDALTEASASTAVGQGALGACTTNTHNTAVGTDCLLVATGGFNTAIGTSSGSQITSGTKNSILGLYNGNNDGLDIRTLSNNIVLSDGDGNTRFFYENATRNWHIKVPANSNNALRVRNTGSTDEYGIQIENSADLNNGSNHFINCIGSSTSRFKVITNGNAVNTNNSYGSISDEKLKENIVDSGSQWDDIKA